MGMLLPSGHVVMQVEALHVSFSPVQRGIMMIRKMHYDIMMSVQM